MKGWHMKNFGRAAIAVIATMSIISVFLGYSVFIEPRSYYVTRLTLDGAPAKTVFLADLHVSAANKDYIRRVVQEVNRLEPGIILVSGDFIMKSEDDIQYLSILSELEGEKYAVLGNHDYLASTDFAGSQMKLREKAQADFSVDGYDVSSLDDGLYNLTISEAVTEKLEAAGFRVLKNEYATFDANGKQILLVGLDDCWAGRRCRQPGFQPRTIPYTFSMSPSASQTGTTTSCFPAIRTVARLCSLSSAPRRAGPG